MKILALDLSVKRTGLAFGDGDGPPELRSASFIAETPGESLWKFQQWLSARLKEYSPDAVIMEAANIAMNAGSSVERARMAVELSGCTRSIVWGRSRMIVHDVMDATWRKSFLGRGRFAKETDPTTGKTVSGGQVAKREALRLCKALGWETLGEDDRAEASGVWVHGHCFIEGGNQRGVKAMLKAARA